MKVYVVIENYCYNPKKDIDNVKTHVSSLHLTKNEAVAAIESRLDEIIDEIKGGDDNNESNISFVNDWDGKEASVGSCNCDETKLSIQEKELTIATKDDDYQKIVLGVREIINNEDLCAEAMVSEIGELVD